MPQQQWPGLRSGTRLVGGGGEDWGRRKVCPGWGWGGVGIGKVEVQQENFVGQRRLSQSSAANFKGLGTKTPEGRVRDSLGL